MTTPPPPPPRLRNIMLGILVVVTLIVFLCSASVIVKWAGTTFLVLPRVVGLLENVRGDEIVALPMDSSPTAAPPWLVGQRVEPGETVAVSFVGRGLMPYDDPRAPGRPILAFEIAQPGTYALSHPRREMTVSLVPDRTTGKEVLVALAFLAQAALLAGPFAIIFGRPWLGGRRAWRRHQQERRRASETMLRGRAGRRGWGARLRPPGADDDDGAG